MLGLAASAVILTGNVLWLAVRPPARGASPPRVHRLLARLTSGVGVGLIAAVPVLFLVTRAMPIDAPHRMGVEESAFFGTWALFAAGALLVPSAAASARFLTALAALGCLAVPIANGVGTGAWPWVSAELGHGVVLGIDLAFLLAGIGLAWGACRFPAGARDPFVQSRRDPGRDDPRG